MSCGLDWKTQEDRLSLGFLSRLSVKGKENAHHLAGNHSVVDSALLDPSKPRLPTSTLVLCPVTGVAHCRSCLLQA